jgi:hypothetical protein
VLTNIVCPFQNDHSPKAAISSAVESSRSPSSSSSASSSHIVELFRLVSSSSVPSFLFRCFVVLALLAAAIRFETRKFEQRLPPLMVVEVVASRVAGEEQCRLEAVGLPLADEQEEDI